MKEKLSGNFVTNYANGKKFPIDVYFRFPDAEEQQRRFPHIAIDLIDIQFDAERAQRALGFLPNAPSETATPPSGFTMTNNDAPLPWTLLYQLATYARDPVHDRWLQGFMYQSFPEQFGFLDMAAFDGSVRRADLLSAVRRDALDDARKRLYRNIFTVGVSSEFYVYQAQYVQTAIEANLTIEGINTDITDTLVIT